MRRKVSKAKARPSMLEQRDATPAVARAARVGEPNRSS
jgi:hypothetical protein